MASRFPSFFKKEEDLVQLFFIGLCALAITYSLSYFSPGLIERGNDLSYWYIYNLSPKPKSSPLPAKIIGIAVDDYSLSRVDQRWPWRRLIYAQLLQALAQERIKVIGMDLAFVGESADPADDLAFAQAIKGTPSCVVLGYFLNAQKTLPVLPFAPLKDASCNIGMLNAPTDLDGKVRRLRGYVESAREIYYSFPVVIAASYLGKRRQEVAAALPLLNDRTFFIKYGFKTKDIINVSFYDALTNLSGVKNKYGEDLFKDSLVMVYPAAEIIHDTHLTPLGKMPGGLLHINGIINILENKFLRQLNLICLPLIVLSFLFITLILRYSGFLGGLLFSAGVLIFNFWALVFLSLTKGIRFDFGLVSTFTLSYFTLGSLYKYVSFLAQIIRIKDKATTDPLRNLFTLRYFYYRLALETRKFYFGRDLFLVFIHINALKEASEELPIDNIKLLWKGLAGVLLAHSHLWSVYSADELVGVSFISGRRIHHDLRDLKEDLEKELAKNNIASGLRLVYLKYKKSYAVRDLLFMLSSEIKKFKEDFLLLTEAGLAKLFASSGAKIKESGKLLESLDADIEERNLQLLSLIENLTLEHGRTKEAFYQIITSLVAALEARDTYTEGHSERVSRYALMLAEKLGWPKEEKEKLRKAALLHDLGKIGIPDAILHKRSGLNQEEMDFIKKHELIGVKILEPLKELKDILPWILYHHERWDGSGYPHGLAAEAIPLAAQIIAIADVFDALTTGRDYKTAFSVEEAIREIREKKGAHFNPRLADLMIEIISGMKNI